MQGDFQELQFENRASYNSRQEKEKVRYWHGLTFPFSHGNSRKHRFRSRASAVRAAVRARVAAGDFRELLFENRAS